MLPFVGEDLSEDELRQREQLRHQRTQLAASHDLDSYFVQQMRALTDTASDATTTASITTENRTRVDW